MVGVLPWAVLILLWWIRDEMCKMPDWGRLGNTSHYEQPWFLGSWFGNDQSGDGAALEALFVAGCCGETSSVMIRCCVQMWKHGMTCRLRVALLLVCCPSS